MRRSRAICVGLAAAAAMLASSCGKQQESMTSRLDYEKLHSSFYGLSRHVQQPELKICLSGAKADSKQAEWAKKAAMAWLDTLRPVGKEAIASEVTIVTEREGCRGTHAKVIVSPRVGRAFCQTSSYPVIHVGYRSDYNTLVHEFGHAFGLGDTYVEGVWTCKRGQPSSLMCSIRYDEPQKDDIDGMRSIYKSIFGGQGEEGGKDPTEVERPNINGRCYCAADQSGRYCGIARDGRWVSPYIKLLAQGNSCNDEFCKANYLETVKDQCDGRLLARDVMKRR